MSDAPAPRTIGILNSTEDVVEILQELLGDEGYATSVAYIPDLKRGRQDVGAWLDDLDPTAIVYDIPPPYEENWRFFQAVRQQPAARRHRFVITTTNLRILEEISGPVEAVEFVGKPFDLSEILGRVQRAIAAIGQGAATGAPAHPDGRVR
jgi:CheY-like chemotaxis protein